MSNNSGPLSSNEPGEHTHVCATHSDLGRLEGLMKDHVDEAIERELAMLRRQAFIDSEPMRHKISHEDHEQSKKDRKQLLLGGIAALITAVVGLLVALVVKGGST